jgi:hypothetical protein
MGRGALARPWWAVFIGVVLVACSNLLLVVLMARGVSVDNTGPMEFGWWIGMGAVAIGAALQMDVQEPKNRPRGGASDG